jgi:hypothetical protein
MDNDLSSKTPDHKAESAKGGKSSSSLKDRKFEKEDLAPKASEGIPSGIRSLRDLIDHVTGRSLV